MPRVAAAVAAWYHAPMRRALATGVVLSAVLGGAAAAAPRGVVVDRVVSVVNGIPLFDSEVALRAQKIAQVAAKGTGAAAQSGNPAALAERRKRAITSLV